jgi:NADPH2:quinone reductase
LNPTDTKLRGGWDGAMEMPFPRIVPHQDGSGEIDRVGAGVPQARVGERVWIYEAQRGRAFGTAAEYVTVPAENAVALPEGASLETGACVGIAGMTAHRCLFQDGGIQGQAVLVAGGGGAVGHAAIQLAKWGGARVVTSVSRPEQEKIALEAGADLVVNRKSEDAAEKIKAFTHGAGVDRVVEVAFEANLDLNRAVLKANGVISTYSSGPPGSAPRIPFTPIMRQGITVHFILVYVMPREAHWAAARDLNAALQAGRYRPHVARTYRLDQIAQAHEAQENGATVGKILIGL